MKRLMVTASLAVGLLAGTQGQARAQGQGSGGCGFGIGIGLGIGFSCSSSCNNQQQPYGGQMGYGGMPYGGMQMPPVQFCQPPIPFFGGGMGGPPPMFGPPGPFDGPEPREPADHDMGDKRDRKDAKPMPRKKKISDEDE